jgi:hypothetical protein
MPPQTLQGKSLRPFFDKLVRDGAAPYDAQRDGPRFMAAVLEYDDPVDCLYRLTNPRVRGRCWGMACALLWAHTPGAAA